MLGRILLVVLALWSGGLLRFVHDVEAIRPSSADADAIVVLTGSAGRITAGLELLRPRPERQMLISGVGYGTDKAALAQAHADDADLIACCVELGIKARDTVGNAAETADWARRNGFTSLIVVTAAYHMPRSLVELRRELGDVRLEPWPTRQGDDDPGRWWRQAATLRRVVLEYHKYVFSLARARLTAAIGDVRP